MNTSTVIPMSYFLRILPIALIAFIPLAFTHAESPGVCTALYQPVCGSKQVECIKAPCYPVYQTYSNMCVLQNDSRATFIHDGECTSTETGFIKPSEPYTPPAGCISWYDGCNSCSKQPNGAVLCTLRACQVGSTQGGYCTAYGSKPVQQPVVITPPAGPIVSGSATVTASTSVGATTTPAHMNIVQVWFVHLIQFFKSLFS